MPQYALHLASLQLAWPSGGCKQQQEAVCDIPVWANICLRHQGGAMSQDLKSKLAFSRREDALTMQVAPSKNHTILLS